ncbi:MAG: PssD/Cps14F family polysaccharide biosynthesis glycosyltransferase [Prochloraceae cyanobacterium]|nr:PssD/Cps14F family polysaccharide biosynthesis glycosyltransferase [Prochloraceae cyanobacterium]
MKILLVSSTGGHFRALQNLDIFWKQYEYCWITFRTEGTEIALKDCQVYWAYSPTNRNLVNLIRNFYLALKVILKEQPQMILSTGAGVSVPFIIIGKIYKCKTVFIESYTRVKDLSLSAKLVLPFLDALYVQWPQLQKKYPRSQLIEPLAVRSKFTKIPSGQHS